MYFCQKKNQMGTFYANNSLFAGNIGQVTYVSGSRQPYDVVPVKIMVSVALPAGQQPSNPRPAIHEASLSIALDNNKQIKFRIDKLLAPFTILSPENPQSGKAVKVRLQIDDDVWEREVISTGAFDGSEELLLGNWLTVAPREASVYVDSPQYLVGYIDDTRLNMGKAEYKARIYFSHASPVVLVLGTAVTGLHCIDCSCQVIASLAEEHGHQDRIVAYDVFCDSVLSSGEERLIQPQRYVVSRGHKGISYFTFLNSLGGIDTVIATGKMKSSMSGDIMTFVNDSVETELVNDAVETVEVNTGYLHSSADKVLWFDFFRSKDRCVADEDGVLRRIIVEEYKCEYTYRELSSFTFKYHLAEKKKQPVREDTALGDYIGGKEI